MAAEDLMKKLAVSKGDASAPLPMEIGQEDHASVAGWGASHAVQRVDHRLQTHLAAIRAKEKEAAAGRRAIAAGYAHAVAVQEPVVRYAHDARDRQIREDDRAYMAAIAEQAIEMMNEDVMALTRGFAARIRMVVDDQALPPADERPWYARLLDPFPEE